MHTVDTTWLPAPMSYAASSATETVYVDTVYNIFVESFVTTKPTFLGKRVVVESTMRNGKHRRFWHLITENPPECDGEEARNIDFTRCERLGWIVPLLSEAPSHRVKAWKESSRGELRYGAALADFSYVVLLAERGDYMHLITAYPVERPRRREKFLDQWKQFRLA